MVVHCSTRMIHALPNGSVLVHPKETLEEENCSDSFGGGSETLLKRAGLRCSAALDRPAQPRIRIPVAMQQAMHDVEPVDYDWIEFLQSVAQSGVSLRYNGGMIVRL